MPADSRWREPLHPDDDLHSTLERTQHASGHAKPVPLVTLRRILRGSLSRLDIVEREAAEMREDVACVLEVIDSAIALGVKEVGRGDA